MSFLSNAATRTTPPAPAVGFVARDNSLPMYTSVARWQFENAHSYIQQLHAAASRQGKYPICAVRRGMRCTLAAIHFHSRKFRSFPSLTFSFNFRFFPKTLRSNSNAFEFFHFSQNLLFNILVRIHAAMWCKISDEKIKHFNFIIRKLFLGWLLLHTLHTLYHRHSNITRRARCAWSWCIDR